MSDTQTTADPPNDQEIDRFIDQLWAEKGLAELTLRAYRQDLRQFLRWLQQRKTGLAEAGQSHIQEYLGERFERGASARSNASSRAGAGGSPRVGKASGARPARTWRQRVRIPTDRPEPTS